jgi:hypothetical protein
MLLETETVDANGLAFGVPVISTFLRSVSLAYTV